jgi:hypothetical protein
MKSFKEYLSEETMPQALTDKEFVGVESEAVRDNINNLLKGVTAKPFVTPYIALERVRKVLAYFHIFLPAYNFMQGDYGYNIFNINQFGTKFGQTNDGDVVVKEDSPYSVYFEYQAGDDGLFDIFCELVTDDELEEILQDYDAESEDNEDNEEEYGTNSQQNYEVNKDEHEGLKEETINELKIGKKELVAAMQRTTGYDAGDDEGRVDSDKLIARAKKYHGEKFAKQLAGADQMTSRPNRNMVPGQWGSDQLAWRKTPRTTKDGKANKTDIKALKASLTKGDYRKPKFKKRNLPESEQINEGRPSQRHPLEGHPYHKKSDAELLYIGKDARNAAEAMKGHNTEAENKYADQANDAATVRYFRKRNGMPNWYKKKYGHDKVTEEKAPFKPTENPSTPYEKLRNKSEQLAREAMRAEIEKGKEEKKRLRKSLREK